MDRTDRVCLALLGAGEKEAAERGLAWLRKTQRSDGGWAAQPGIDESNWSTSLAALLPREALGAQRHAAAIGWLMATTGQESTFEFRLREWLLGNSSKQGPRPAGWPWIPGAGAWVGPTAVAILALDKENRRRPLVGIRQRVETGRTFLLQRACVTAVGTMVPCELLDMNRKPTRRRREWLLQRCGARAAGKSIAP